MTNYVLDGIIPYKPHLIQALIPHDNSFSCVSDFNSHGTRKAISRPIDISRLVMVRCILGERYNEPLGRFDGVVGGTRSEKRMNAKGEKYEAYRNTI